MVKLIKDGHGRWSPYFTALTHFEAAVAQLYLALDSVRKLRTHDFFRKGDGSFEESVVLNDPARGLLVAPFVWHELTDFAEGSVILVMASDLYEEAEYLRDYDEFKRLASQRAP